MNEAKYNHEYDYNHTVCYHCRDYYGPCYGQPLCGTCHNFVCPADPFNPPNLEENLRAMKELQDNADEYDSGNEEPKESQAESINDAIGRSRIHLSLSDRDGIFSARDSDENGSFHRKRPVRTRNGNRIQDQPIEKVKCDHLDKASSYNVSIDPPSDQSSSNYYPEYDNLSEAEFMKILRQVQLRERNSQSDLHNVMDHLNNGEERKCLCVVGEKPSPLQKRICRLSEHHTTDSLEHNFVLPPEVWTMIFKMLDDVSLWQCSRVSVSWRELILRNWGHNKWREFTRRRWRFFKPLYKAVYWHSIFSNLMESSPCHHCQIQMFEPMDPLSLRGENSWRMTRLKNENRNFRVDPPEGIEASPLDEHYLQWQASIRGPDQSPYQGGTFFLHILIPPRYPLVPPVVRILTKIFHPNISRHGDIGIDSIQHNWSLALTISKILISIQSLLTDPYTRVCMEPVAGNLYEKDRAKFDTIAKEWTWRFAMVDVYQPNPNHDEMTLCEALTEHSENSLDDANLVSMDDEDDNDQDNNDNDNNDQDNDNNEQEADNDNNDQDNPENDNNDQDNPEMDQDNPEMDQDNPEMDQDNVDNNVDMMYVNIEPNDL